MHKPSLCHFQAVKWILRYVKGTLRYGFSFTSFSSCNILVYSDTNQTGCLDTHWSIFGYAIYLGDNLISWHSKKQPIVPRSNCESDYQALACTIAKVKWLSHLLCDLKVTSSSSSILLCDNQSFIFLTANPASQNRLSIQNSIIILCMNWWPPESFGFNMLLPISSQLMYSPRTLVVLHSYSFVPSLEFGILKHQASEGGITTTKISPISSQDQDQIPSLQATNVDRIF